MSLSPSRCLSVSLSMTMSLALTGLSAADFPPVDQLKPTPGLPDPLVMLDGTKITTKEAVGSQAQAGAEGPVPALHVRPPAAAARPQGVSGQRVARLPGRQGRAERSEDHLHEDRDRSARCTCSWSRPRGSSRRPSSSA